jgi:hypothetical protein
VSRLLLAPHAAAVHRQRTSHQATARLGAGGTHLKRARHPTAPAKPPRLDVNVVVSTASQR